MTCGQGGNLHPVLRFAVGSSPPAYQFAIGRIRKRLT